MKKNYFTLFIIWALLSNASWVYSQCDGHRFHDSTFSAYTLTSNIIYGNNIKTSFNYTATAIDLKLDFYEPTGDLLPLRPLVIVAHGGSFISGSKTGSDVVPLCKDLTKLGYVAASIDYRIGMTNFPTSTHALDSTDAGAAVMRAVHDGRAAVRFFRKNARDGGNTYRIDTNNIYFAGVSAGGFIALHIAYMDLLSEFPTYVDTVGQPGLHGGLEGLSGNPGYPSDVKGIINVCGALGQVAWMKAGDKPVLSFHGTADNVVPYGTALIYLSGHPLLIVDGSSSVAARATQLGIENCMITWPGQPHVPEVGTSSTNLLYYDSMKVITRNWLEHQLCNVTYNCTYLRPIGISESSFDNALLNVYPNPASASVTIDLSSFEHKEVQVNIYDNLGKKVKSINSVKDDKVIIPRDHLKNGIYLISVISDGRNYSQKIILE
jgi:para-nitrobenzyl esterase